MAKYRYRRADWTGTWHPVMERQIIEALDSAFAMNWVSRVSLWTGGVSWEYDRAPQVLQMRVVGNAIWEDIPETKREDRTRIIAVLDSPYVTGITVSTEVTRVQYRWKP